jgi:hypothetical protein
MNYLKVFLLSLILTLPFTNIVFSESITLDNKEKFLGRLSSKDLNNPFSISIKLNGDIPLATYVTARFQNNQPKQRLANSLWVDWDEKVETLQNNGFIPTGDDLLIFNIFEEKLNLSFLPLIITISYINHDNLKSGYFVVDQ